MSRQNRDLSKHGLRFIENAQLSQNCCPVIIDFLPRQIVIGVEGIYTAKGELDPSPRRLKSTPPAEVCAANQDFNENGVFCDMLTLWVLSLSPRSRLKPHRTKRLVRNDECTEHGLELGMGV